MMRYFPALLIGLIGAAVLTSLGVWQVQRLAWKEAMLAEIEARIHASPVAVPGDPDPLRDRYLPVQVSGRTADRELLVLVSTRQLGAGFRLEGVYEDRGDNEATPLNGYMPTSMATLAVKPE